MTTPQGPGRLVIVSGPSGGGKTTVVQKLLGELPRLVRSVSVTTRPQRPDERNGYHYRFVTEKRFEQLRGRGELLEWAKVHGAFYGTPKAPIKRLLANGRDVMLSIDVQGARQVRRRFGSRAVLIFLMPPSLKDLKARLMKRATDSPRAIQRRLAVAKRELSCAAWYDYTIVNRRLHEAVEQLRAVLVAERLRVRPTRSYR